MGQSQTEPAAVAAGFPKEKWELPLQELSKQFREAAPFSYICLDGFLSDETVRMAARQFPPPDSDGWTRYRHFNERTLGQSQRESLPPAVARIVDELNSDGFLEWVAALTGIPDLLADPDLAGGGMHQTESGGFLRIHADFQSHPYRKGWRRRCNLILYLNEAWEDAWGGQLEFWDGDVQNREVQISPLLNRAVIFSTTTKSFHGYPEPIQCPSGVTRKSLALYYYTADDAAKVSSEPTRYYPRPGDRAATRLFTHVDNLLLRVYAWIKRRFRISDRFASWLLGLFSK